MGRWIQQAIYNMEKTAVSEIVFLNELCQTILCEGPWESCICDYDCSNDCGCDDHCGCDDYSTCEG